MKKVCQSEILEVLHGMAEDLHEIGAINDARMAEYDRDCLVQKKSQPLNAGNTGIQPVTTAFAGHKG
jgi:DNA-binding transcriptional regulator YiaG